MDAQGSPCLETENSNISLEFGGPQLYRSVDKCREEILELLFVFLNFFNFGGKISRELFNGHSFSFVR